MSEGVQIPSVHIGKQDLYEWLTYEGKPYLMPELLTGFEKILYEGDIEEIKVFRVETLIRDQQKAFDFFARKWEMEDTLDKIMEWALEDEEYEICERVKNIREYIHNNPPKKKTTLL